MINDGYDKQPIIRTDVYTGIVPLDHDKPCICKRTRV